MNSSFAKPAPSFVDQCVNAIDNALRSLHGAHRASRACPEAAEPTAELADRERRLSASLMRVNHVGEICAQALYQAQALATRNPKLKAHFEAAADEETDHLAWTRQRLEQLQSRPSLLNPLWYAGAFGLGLLAGKAGDAISLGFVAETEHQVEQHLASHLKKLPAHDATSRAIVEQMKTDESRHAAEAIAAGGIELPRPVRLAMRAAAKVMTTTAHHI